MSHFFVEGYKEVTLSDGSTVEIKELTGAQKMELDQSAIDVEMEGGVMLSRLNPAKQNTAYAKAIAATCRNLRSPDKAETIKKLTEDKVLNKLKYAVFKELREEIDRVNKMVVDEEPGKD